MKAKDLCSNILSIERNWRHVMKKQKKGRRFSISAVRQAPEPRAIEMEPEELAVYFCHAEKKVLPIIKERQLDPGAAQSLLAQQTHVLVTADPCLTTESGIAIANSVLADWQEGNSMPDRRPPTHWKRHCRGYRKVHKKRRTTWHVSSRSPLPTERRHAASVK
jgi:hypothetical protein